MLEQDRGGGGRRGYGLGEPRRIKRMWVAKDTCKGYMVIPRARCSKVEIKK